MRVRLFILVMFILLALISCTERISYVSKFEALKLTFSPSSGNYYNEQELKITCNYNDADIYYTVDGSTPSESSNKYSSYISIDKSMTIKAIAYKNDWYPSEVRESKYVLISANPTFDPPAGPYDTIQKVSIICKTANANIYYTLDGKEPTSASIEYTEPIEVSSNITIKAIAYKDGWQESVVSSSVYNMSVNYVATPAFNPPAGQYDKEQTVTISCSTVGSEIYYTLDGQEPTKSSLNYTGPIEVQKNTTIKAKGFKVDLFDSKIETANYTLKVSTPDLYPPAGSYDTIQKVTISCATAEARIYYTLDGKEPTSASIEYSEPIEVSSNITIKAIAYKDGWQESVVSSSVYDMSVNYVATPTFSPPAGQYDKEQTVTISCSTVGSEIYYTLDGQEPTKSSLKYTDPIVIPMNTVVKAKGFKESWFDSQTSVAEYNLGVVIPIIDPPGGTYYNDQMVAISCSTAGAVIRYTTDGSNPNSSSTIYTDPINVSSSKTIKAKAFKGGYTESEIASADYQLKVTEPTMDPPGGTYSNVQTVTLSCSTVGAVIRYTTGGGNPNSSSTIYTDPINVSSSQTIKARAFKEGWLESEIASADYQLKVAKPTFNPPGGEYTAGQKITMTSATNGAEIRYTTDGKEPTKSSLLYTTPVNVNYSLTLKAKAFKDGWKESDTSNGSYDILMILVEGGSFQMGSTSGDSDERPIHTVTVNSFYIGKYELTQKEWVEVMGSNPSYYKGDNLPVEKVTWYNVIDYCNKRSVQEGLTPCYSINGNTKPSSWTSGIIVCNWSANGYRLPTEAEWEYAARGGKQSKGYTYSGSNTLSEVGWYYSNSGDKTHPVGEKKGNELGIFDMSGNVWEWCWDWYNSSYYSSSPQNNPKGPDSGSYRVIRGGSYNNVDVNCRVANRGNINPSYSNVDLGVRLVRVFP